MFYSAQWRENPNNEVENFRIGVAESQSPTGPFKEMHDGPIFGHVCSSRAKTNGHGRFESYNDTD